ncbi:MAG: hypothetical protein KBD66_01175 [Candidatus Doudnabacteria bacterium]|nr:hypothetical protein [Candidatus Doudnabacteria bacterium]
MATRLLWNVRGCEEGVGVVWLIVSVNNFILFHEHAMSLRSGVFSFWIQLCAVVLLWAFGYGFLLRPTSFLFLALAIRFDTTDVSLIPD